jgi:hypothetical protein
MKFPATLLFLCLVVGSALAEPPATNQTWQVCRYPLRIFPGNRVVNLAPLFGWWLQQPAPTNAAQYKMANLTVNTNAGDEPPTNGRPLAAWHLVTGRHAASAGSSWVIDAVVYTSPGSRTNARVILQNPPAGEERSFELLRNQIAEAGREIADAERAQQAALKKVQQAQNRAYDYAHSHTKVASTGYGTFMGRARQYQQEADTAASQKQQLEALRSKFEEQLANIPAVKGEYWVDWFAMQVGHTKAGLPVYDLGIPNPALP